MTFETMVAPFIGQVRAIGAGGANVPIVRLRNPVGSGKRLVVFKLRVSGHTPGGGSAILVVSRRTRTPVTLAGTTFPGKVIQFDSQIPTVTPLGVLEAATDTLAGTTAHFIPADATAQSVINQIVEENTLSEPNWPFRRGRGFPLSILPGSAFEAFGPAGYGGHLRLNAVWDEVAYP